MDTTVAIPAEHNFAVLRRWRVRGALPATALPCSHLWFAMDGCFGGPKVVVKGFHIDLRSIAWACPVCGKLYGQEDHRPGRDSEQRNGRAVKARVYALVAATWDCTWRLFPYVGSGFEGGI